MNFTHLDRFPCMSPRIGESYHSPRHKRLLVIGESHYLPDGSTVHHDPQSWYESNEKALNAAELGWISTARIISDAKNEGFRNRAHGIFKQVSKILGETLNLEDWPEGIEHCAYLNYFQRPAEKQGGSIRVSALDIEVASEALKRFIKEQKPELVAVVSSKAGRYARQVLSSMKVPYCVTPHPTCQWWNRAAGSYGGKVGRMILPDFLAESGWAESSMEEVGVAGGGA